MKSATYPYQRPPLSKGLLTGKTHADQLLLRGAEFFEQNRIELRLGLRVTALDAGTRRIELRDRSALGYRWLALTTGARCRPLPVPGADLENVLQLRTLDDSLDVVDAASRSQHTCVIGGGFIGLEVAAALHGRGVKVTVIEAQPRLLARSVSPPMSSFVASAHRRRGVELLTGRAVRALLGHHGRVVAVGLTDGLRIDCDLVVLGIGVLPNTELAQQAGITIDNGILTDATGRTSAPGVLAAGDAACVVLPPSTDGPARVRLESIQAANDGGRSAASVVVGRSQPNVAVPWFWSDQFDLKFQMAGLPMRNDEIVIRGDIDSERFSLFYLRRGRVAAAHSVNRPAEHMQSRKLIAARAKLSPQQLADPSLDLRDVT